MITRVLPITEWDKLPESLDPIVMKLLPSRSRVVVVEDDGEIVGHVLVFMIAHAECLEIAPKYRKKASVLRRLLKGMYAAANELGVDRVWAASVSAEMTGILAHPSLSGTPIPALSVVLPVKGHGICLPS